MTIFYCLNFLDSPNLEGQIPAFISPRNWVAQLLGLSKSFTYYYIIYLKTIFNKSVRTSQETASGYISVIQSRINRHIHSIMNLGFKTNYHKVMNDILLDISRRVARM
jgi:hypothetical protein